MRFRCIACDPDSTETDHTCCNSIIWTGPDAGEPCPHKATIRVSRYNLNLCHYHARAYTPEAQTPLEGAKR